MVAETPPGLRVRQGLLLLAGALALDLLVAEGGLRFFWTPLILGLSYLAAAAVGGRRGSYWATALVLTGWGAVVVLIGETRPTNIDPSGAYLVGAGLGILAGQLLARTGFAVSAIGLSATAAAAGLVLALSPTSSALVDARTFAIALGVVGILNVVLGAVAARE